VVGILADVLVGLVPGILAGSGQMQANHTIGRIIGAAGAIGGLISGLVILRMALRKHYRGFRIALVPIEPPAPVKL
jgi:hypothetical protein